MAIAVALWVGYQVLEQAQPATSVIEWVQENAAPSAAAATGESAPRLRFVAPVKPQARDLRASDVPDAATASAPELPVANHGQRPALRSSAAPKPTAAVRSNARPATTAPSAPRTVSVAHVNAAEIADDLRRAADATGSGAAGPSSPDYQTLLEQRLREAMERVLDLDPDLNAEAEFRLLAKGSTTQVRLTRPSGNVAFDTAVIAVIRELRLPPPPSGFPEVQRIPFHTHRR